MRTIIEYMQLCPIHLYQKIARKKVARVNAALWTFLTTVYQQCKKNIGKKQKDLRLCWPLIVLSINKFILLNRNFYL